jgi:hypothetical protein
MHIISSLDDQDNSLSNSAKKLILNIRTETGEKGYTSRPWVKGLKCISDIPAAT